MCLMFKGYRDRFSYRDGTRIIGTFREIQLFSSGRDGTFGLFTPGQPYRDGTSGRDNSRSITSKHYIYILQTFTRKKVNPLILQNYLEEERQGSELDLYAGA